MFLQWHLDETTALWEIMCINKLQKKESQITGLDMDPDVTVDQWKLHCFSFCLYQMWSQFHTEQFYMNIYFLTDCHKCVWYPLLQPEWLEHNHISNPDPLPVHNKHFNLSTDFSSISLHLFTKKCLECRDSKSEWRRSNKKETNISFTICLLTSGQSSNFFQWCTPCICLPAFGLPVGDARLLVVKTKK